MFPRAVCGNSPVSTGSMWKQLCFHGLGVAAVWIAQAWFWKQSCFHGWVWNQLCFHGLGVETILSWAGCGYSSVPTGSVWKQSLFKVLCVEAVVFPCPVWKQSGFHMPCTSGLTEASTMSLIQPSCTMCRTNRHDVGEVGGQINTMWNLNYNNSPRSIKCGCLRHPTGPFARTAS